MSFIPPGYAQVNHRMRDTGTSRVFECTYGLAITGADEATLADDVDAAWWSEIGPLLANQISSDGTVIRIGTADPAAPIVLESAGGNSGSTGDPTVPQNVAVLIKKVPALVGGRKNRGRMYLPMPAFSSVTEGGFLSTSAFSSYQDRVDDWIVALLAVDGVDETVVLHSVDGEDPAVIGQWVVQQKLATQRRRLRG